MIPPKFRRFEFRGFGGSSYWEKVHIFVAPGFGQKWGLKFGGPGGPAAAEAPAGGFAQKSADFGTAGGFATSSEIRLPISGRPAGGYRNSTSRIPRFRRAARNRPMCGFRVTSKPRPSWPARTPEFRTPFSADCPRELVPKFEFPEFPTFEEVVPETSAPAGPP